MMLEYGNLEGPKDIIEEVEHCNVSLVQHETERPVKGVALTLTGFHSQNLINHAERGYTILIIARDQKMWNGITVPYTYLDL